MSDETENALVATPPPHNHSKLGYPGLCGMLINLLLSAGLKHLGASDGLQTMLPPVCNGLAALLVSDLLRRRQEKQARVLEQARQRRLARERRRRDAKKRGQS